MTTPAPPSLAALYAERAAFAYQIEHGGHTPARRHALERDYDEIQHEIATQAAQWPARGVRRTEEAQP